MQFKHPFLAFVLFAGLPTLALSQVTEKEKEVIDKGVAYLKSLQTEKGYWPHPEKIGMTALAGLALLEAGVPASDACIQRAAKFVRSESVEANKTYSLATAMLFLHRLGYEEDMPIIEVLGVRLWAGQNAYGGWGYFCPWPKVKESDRLEKIVRSVHDAKDLTKRSTSERKLSTEAKEQLDAFKRERKRGDIPEGLGDTSNTFLAVMALAGCPVGLPLDEALTQTDRRFCLSQKGGWAYYPGTVSTVGYQPVTTPIQAPNAGNGAMPVADARTSKMIEEMNKNMKGYYKIIVAHGIGVTKEGLPPGVREGRYSTWGNCLTSVMPPGVSGRDPEQAKRARWIIYKDGYLNNNIQAAPPTFTITQLAPVVQTCPFIFLETMMETGKMDKSMRPVDPTPAMTADGVFCLAMGTYANPAPAPFLGYESGMVEYVRRMNMYLGLMSLSKNVGTPVGNKAKVKAPKIGAKDNGYYYLWSLSQTARALDLKTIGGKDWEAWGKEIIVANQRADGGWQGGFGTADTAFALLFLTKSNQVPEAAGKLRGLVAGSPGFLPLNEAIIRKTTEEAGK